MAMPSRYLRKLAESGVPLPEVPDSACKRRGRSVAGLRGAAPRYVERDARIAELIAAGRTAREVAGELGISAAAARHGLRAHRDRQERGTR